MTRIFGHYVPLEMMLLWIVELTGCFVLGYVLLDSGMGGIAVTGGHRDVNMVAADAAAVLAISVGLTSFAIGLYQPETFLRLQRLFAKTAVAGALSFPAIWILGHLAGIDFSVLMGHGAPELLKMLAAWVALVMIIRLAFSYSLRMNLFTRRIVLVTADVPGDALALEGANRTGRAIQHLRNGVFETVGAVMRFDPEKDDANRLMEQLRRRRVWGVVMVAPGPDGDAAEQMMRSSGAALGGIKVWRDRVFWEGQLRRVDIDQLGGTAPDFKALARSGWLQASIRRASDIALSLFLLSFTLPLMLFAALAIRLDSRGPIFYRQERVGLHGRIFTLCKFRSMRTDAEVTGPVWAAQKIIASRASAYSCVALVSMNSHSSSTCCVVR